MAGYRIIDRNPLTGAELASGDAFLVYDVSESSNVATRTKQITWAQLLSGLGSTFTPTASLGALATLNSVGSSQVDNSAITFHKIQNVSASRIIGRLSAGPGIVEELTAANVKTILALSTSDISGLGTAATQNTGTSGANVPLLNGNNTHSGSNTFTGAVIRQGTYADYSLLGSAGGQGMRFALDGSATQICYLQTTQNGFGTIVNVATINTNSGALAFSARPTFNGNTALDTGNGVPATGGTFSGSVAINSTLTLGNNKNVQFKDSGGTVNGYLYLDSSNVLTLQSAVVNGTLRAIVNGGSAKFTVHQQGGSEVFSVGYGGDVNVTDTLTIANTKALQFKSSGGSVYAVMYMYSDNHIYIDQQLSGGQIIFRGPSYTEVMRVDGANRLQMSKPMQFKSYTVAGLPAGAAGDSAFASNGRAYNGAGTLEGAGAGTGVAVTHNGTAWKIAGTNQTVQA